ncbi:apolipoprotein N-acyltransferase [Nitratiruptor sp. YY09-18]|nr:apolipoprotein N-acyltransferase [Nitratiruptor sp. YY09-18]
MPALCPCMNIPLFQNFSGYSTIKLLIKSFLIALLLSAFLFLEYFGIKSRLLLSLFGIFGFYLLINCKRLFWVGFFIGLFWFWWIGMSFRYYDLKVFVPIAIIFIALFYGVLFKIIESIARIAAKIAPFLYHVILALALLVLSYIHPFGFNWFIPEIVFVDSYFGYDKLHFAFILTGLVLLSMKKILPALLGITLLLFALHSYPASPLAPLRIKLVTTHIPQDKKWKIEYLPTIIKQNFAAIDEAINEHYDVVVLPESAYPTFLQRNTALLLELLERSKKITIITGALHLQNSRVYNATYLFAKGNYTIMHKVVLVPFGEYVPLPKPLGKFVNHYFFNDATDFTPAKNLQIYSVDGVEFTNAICYEATADVIYTTPTQYIIAISNNAWFLPSYEPQLQNRIIKYYATIHHKTVYHATNIAQTKVIR